MNKRLEKVVFSLGSVWSIGVVVSLGIIALLFLLLTQVWQPLSAEPVTNSDLVPEHVSGSAHAVIIKDLEQRKLDRQKPFSGSDAVWILPSPTATPTPTPAQPPVAQ